MLDPYKAQVCLCFDLSAGAERVVEAGREFFRLGLRMLGHELLGQLNTAVADGSYLGLDRTRASEGGISAHCNLDMELAGRIRKRSFTYTPKKYEEMISKLGMLPVFSAIGIETWEPRDGPIRLGFTDPSLGLVWDRDPTRGRLANWVILYVTTSSEHLLGTPERQQDAVTFLHAVAERTNPACGEISYQPPDMVGGAPLEHLLRRSREEAVTASREVIRSYSWVTLISEEIGQRLGGLPFLEESGAFHTVDHLSAGGFVLQATDRFDEYKHSQAYKVFRTLAPALPSGTPRAPKVYPPTIPIPDEPDFCIIQKDPTEAQDDHGNGSQFSAD